MKRIFYLFLMALCGALAASARVYEVKTGEFNKLNVPDNLNVVYECDQAKSGTARFECEDSMADALMFTNTGDGKLKVQLSADFIGKNLDYPTIYVFSEFLTEVESSSENKVVIKSLPRSPEFKAVLFGNGAIELCGMNLNKLTAALMTGHGLIKIDGNVGNALFKLAGTGHIDASGLEADKVSCHVFGGGEIHCRPKEELKLKGLGSTTVYYSGKPAKIKKQGIGKLVHVGD